MEFKDRIKKARNAKGMSAKQLLIALEHEAGRDPVELEDETRMSKVYMWEKGKSKPDINTLVSLCKVLDVSADWLLGLEKEPLRDILSPAAFAALISLGNDETTILPVINTLLECNGEGGADIITLIAGRFAVPTDAYVKAIVDVTINKGGSKLIRGGEQIEQIYDKGIRNELEEIKNVIFEKELLSAINEAHRHYIEIAEEAERGLHYENEK
jgi:transcriptional regulator with XRE-family HTH domain